MTDIQCTTIPTALYHTVRSQNLYSLTCLTEVAFTKQEWNSKLIGDRIRRGRQLSRPRTPEVTCSEPASRSPHHTLGCNGVRISLDWEVGILTTHTCDVPSPPRIPFNATQRSEARAAPLVCAHVYTSVCVWEIFRFLNKTHNGGLAGGALEGGGDRRPGEFSRGDHIIARIAIPSSNPRRGREKRRVNRWFPGRRASHAPVNVIVARCIPIFSRVSATSRELSVTAAKCATRLSDRDSTSIVVQNCRL